MALVVLALALVVSALVAKEVWVVVKEVWVMEAWVARVVWVAVVAMAANLLSPMCHTCPRTVCRTHPS